MDVTWHRADHGDEPELGSEITCVMYPTDSPGSVVVYSRMRVEVLLPSVRGLVIGGPHLPSELRFDLPGRPEPFDAVGRRAIFWRPYDDGE